MAVLGVGGGGQTGAAGATGGGRPFLLARSTECTIPTYSIISMVLTFVQITYSNHW